METLNQLGLQSLYKDAVNEFFYRKFKCNKIWYEFLKEFSKAQGIRMAQAWYQILYFTLR